LLKYFNIFNHIPRINMKKLCLIVLVGIFSQQVVAQSFYNRRIDRPWIASFGTGSAKYFGDLANPGELFQGTRINIEGGLEYRFDPRYSVRASLTYFQLKGDDKDADSEGRGTRNLNFTGNNFELSAVGVVMLFEEVGRYYQRPSFNANLFLGVAALYFQPRTDIPATDYNGNSFPDAGKMTPLRQYQTELVKYSPVTLAIPMGLGIKMMMTPFLNIAVSGGYRFTLTDYLDDISTEHPGPAAFSDPYAQALSDRRPEIGLQPRPTGSIRGNPDKKDGYFMLSIRAEYYLPPHIFGNISKSSSLQRRRYKKARGR
jgi:hypothetical protein